MPRLLLLLILCLLLSACGGATGEPPPWETNRAEKPKAAERVVGRRLTPDRW